MTTAPNPNQAQQQKLVLETAAARREQERQAANARLASVQQALQDPNPQAPTLKPKPKPKAYPKPYPKPDPKPNPKQALQELQPRLTETLIRPLEEARQ